MLRYTYTLVTTSGYFLDYTSIIEYPTLEHIIFIVISILITLNVVVFENSKF